ncbi:MAG TPA: Holliday junction branch migration protein RuvA [Spirochaetia bacterium]|nr:Holliday junction branch migration protein RuvA [Spirochaetia bacterium]
MFNSLVGTISDKDKDTVLLTIGGIEWELSISSQTSSQLPDKGEQAKIYTFLYHRDDQLKLFGFSTLEERELFLGLTRVEGVGPRLALKILSGTGVADFLSAVENEDMESLVCIPGLGKKTAQKIIFQLKGKISLMNNGATAEHEDIVQALAGMGFDRREAKHTVMEVMKELKGHFNSAEDLERELLRKSLQRIGSKT